MTCPSTFENFSALNNPTTSIFVSCTFHMFKRRGLSFEKQGKQLILNMLFCILIFFIEVQHKVIEMSCHTPNSAGTAWLIGTVVSSHDTWMRPSRSFNFQYHIWPFTTVKYLAITMVNGASQGFRECLMCIFLRHIPVPPMPQYSRELRSLPTLHSQRWHWK